jgi:hypothetical protein
MHPAKPDLEFHAVDIDAGRICRPPGAVHGPYKSTGGCLLLEVHYYG